MRYLFAAVIAVFVVAVDFRSSDTSSVWTEPSFVAEAQSEPIKPPDTSTSQNAKPDDATKVATAESSAPDAAHDSLNINASDAAPAVDPAASIKEDPQSSDPICEKVKAAAEEHNIPIGFFVRLLWQESRFKATEVSSAGAQGIAQFMPQTAIEIGLKNPFDPLQAIPASARFLRKLYDQFGNLGLAAAAYNAGGGRIEKWLSRHSSLPRETQAYVKIITGHKAEAWTDEDNTVYMPTDLPQKAPCEGVGGLSRTEQVAAVNVDLTPAASALVRKAEVAEAEDKQKAVTKKLRVAISDAARSSKARGRSVVLAAKISRKPGKKPIVRFASSSRAR